MRQGLLFVLSGPSGVGKSTLTKRLREKYPEFGFSVSYTTRSPREGEVHGKDYYFVSRQDFTAMIAKGDFLEFAEVHGEFYGTAKQLVEEDTSRGKDILLDIDYQGARQIRIGMPEAVTIFVRPPSIEELERRLRSRGTESEESIARRLSNATEELNHEVEFDEVVSSVNNKEETFRQLDQIVCHYRGVSSFS